MGLNVAQKLIKSHLLSGAMTVGKEIGIRIDQTLTQDATGILVMLELESMGLDSARTELSCQYVDHNLIQEDGLPVAVERKLALRKSAALRECHWDGVTRPLELILELQVTANQQITV